MRSSIVPQARLRREVENERLVQAVTLIHRRAHDPRFGVADVAEELHISVRQLYRCFSGRVGPAELISRRRTATAVAFMLADPELAVSEVAVSAGFSEPTTLRDHLHRYAGMGARELRRGIRNLGPRTLRVTPGTVNELLREPQSAWVPVSEHAEASRQP